MKKCFYIQVLTHSMHKELWLAGEVEVDYNVKHGNVDAASCDVSHKKNMSLLVCELGHIDFPCGLVEGAEYVRTADACLFKQLKSGEN